eukprot:1143638-Pelagomonas_calceolata.AAC.11
MQASTFLTLDCLALIALNNLFFTIVPVLSHSPKGVSFGGERGHPAPFKHYICGIFQSMDVGAPESLIHTDFMWLPGVCADLRQTTVGLEIRMNFKHIVPLVACKGTALHLGRALSGELNKLPVYPPHPPKMAKP